MERTEFLEALKKSVAEKSAALNAKEIPQMLESYRLMYTCVHNLYDLMVKRSLITPDPYKADKKLVSIQVPDNTPFADTERALVIGSRFSDYETTLDFICTYLNLSIENLNLQQIKKLSELNDCIQWTNMSMNSASPNTRGLSLVINELKQNLPIISMSLLKDSLSKSGKSISEITGILKELTVFKREEYKLKIREEIIHSPHFPLSSVSTPSEEIAEIKKLFPSVMKKTPLYNELLNEITEEDFSADKENLQQNVLERLKVRDEKPVKEKEAVNTKTIILETVRIISALSPTYALIAEKLAANTKVLEDKKNTPIQKLKVFLRQVFNIKDKPVVYRFIIEDKQKGTKIPRDIEIMTFIDNTLRKSHFLAALGTPASPESKKIAASPEEAILQFVNKQLSDNKEMLALFTAADDYFKTAASSANRSKIKGLKIDLVSVNNALVKANKRRAEYTAIVEEINQMKKLGIKDE